MSEYTEARRIAREAIDAANKQLAEYQAKTNAEVSRIRKSYADNVERMQASMEKQRQEYQDQLIKLQREMGENIAATREHLNAELKRQAEEIRNQLDALNRHHQNELNELRDEMERKLEEANSQFNQALKKLYDQLHAAEEFKRRYAEERMTSLKASVDRMMELPAVARFRQNQANRLIEQYNKLCSQTEPIIVITTATQLSINVESLMIEAEKALDTWQHEHDNVLKALHALEARCEETMTAGWVLRLGNYEVNQALRPWAGKAFQAIADDLHGYIDRMTPGTDRSIQDIYHINQKIMPLESSLDAAAATAQREISFFMLTQLVMKLACEHLMDEHDWELMQEPAYVDESDGTTDERKISGTALLNSQRGFHETMQVVVTRGLGHSPTVRLDLLHSGPRSQDVRDAMLREIANTMSMAISDSDAGGLISSVGNSYRDGDICGIVINVSTTSVDAVPQATESRSTDPASAPEQTETHKSTRMRT